MFVLTKKGVKFTLGSAETLTEGQRWARLGSRAWGGVRHSTVHPTHLQNPSWQVLPRSSLEVPNIIPKLCSTEHTYSSLKALQCEMEWKLSWENWFWDGEITSAWRTKRHLQVSELHDQDLCSNLSVPAKGRWERRATRMTYVPGARGCPLFTLVDSGWGIQITTLIKLLKTKPKIVSGWALRNSFIKCTRFTAPTW